MLGRLFGGLVRAAYGSIESVSADVVGSGTKGMGMGSRGRAARRHRKKIRVPTNAMPLPNPEPSKQDMLDATHAGCLTFTGIVYGSGGRALSIALCNDSHGCRIHRCEGSESRGDGRQGRR